MDGGSMAGCWFLRVLFFFLVAVAVGGFVRVIKLRENECG